jgi:hypothetical protein
VPRVAREGAFELREPEDLELPPDLLCAIPSATIPPPRAARAAPEAERINWLKSDQD